MAGVEIVRQRYIERFPIAEVVPDPDNPWQGDDEGVGESIDALGFYGAILLQEGTFRLVAGHTRIRQAQARGAECLPALVVEVDDLWQARALVGDNRTNQRGRFVDEPLGRVLARLRDADALAGTGFAEPDLADVVKRLDRAARATSSRRAVRPAETPEGTAEVVQGDARVLDGIADGSVDLIVTSPPYFALRSYRDGGEHYDGQIGSEPSPEEFLAALWACTATWWAKLKPTGSLWVNLGDKYAGSNPGPRPHGPASSISAHQQAGQDEQQVGYDVDTNIRPKSLIGVPWRYAIGCIDGLAAPDGQRWILRAEVVWSKPNGLPESVTDRVRRSHEQWFHLVKSEHYYAAIDEVRERHGDEPTQADYDAQRVTSWTYDDPAVSGHNRHSAIPVLNHPLGRVPGSVWSVPSEPLTVPDGFSEHFAAFPQEFPRRIILGWSPPAWCDGCGEPRRPVVEKSAEYLAHRAKYGDYNSDRRSDDGYDQNVHKAGAAPTPPAMEPRVVGYECGCDDQDAPTSRSVVIDPFGGTGTTAMVARALGRHGISVDLSADYCDLARWRIFESGHWQKSIDRTREEHEDDGTPVSTEA
jgi:DNA modification methylase